MIRYRWVVVAVWALVLLVSLVAMSGLSDLLTNRFSLPGTDTARAESILEEEFGQKSTGSFSIVVEGQPGSAEALVPRVRAAAERAAAELPTGRLAGVQPVSDAVVSAQIVSNLEPADAKGHTDDMRAAAGEIPGADVYVSGQAAIEHDLDPVFTRDLQVGELYIAIPIALLILVFVFGTLAFLIPFMFAAAAIPATLGIIWIFANFMELTTYLQNLVMLIGFGIAIDYSLLVVYRYREELASGKSKEDAIVRTMETAGRAVVFSGSAVGHRPGAHALHAASLHAGLRHRRARHPTRLRRLRPYAPARPPVLPGGQARPRAPASAAGCSSGARPSSTSGFASHERSCAARRCSPPAPRRS